MKPHHHLLSQHFSQRTVISLSLGAVLMSPLAALAQSPNDIQQLKDSAQQMQRTINSLNTRIAELENQQNPRSKKKKSLGTPSKVIIPLMPIVTGRQSPVVNRDSFNDQQEAVSRPLDFTLTPQPKGYIPVPNSGLMMKFDLRPRVDVTVDHYNSGSPSRFIPAKFALKGAADFSDATRSNISANGSQLRVDVRNPELDGNFRVYYQNDFYGDSSDKKMALRVQQFYAQYFGFKAGFATSAWEDGDVWPDTVDYEGPNSLVFARRATLQYTHAINDLFSAKVGLDDPNISVDGAQAINQVPDLTANLRWEDSAWGHVQFSAIARRIGASETDGTESYVNAWGINLGSSLKVTDTDSLQLLGVVGKGIGALGNDAGFYNSDAGFSSGGQLESLPYWSVMGGYTHHWASNLASTATFGYVDLSNASGQAGDFYHNTTYVSTNLIWQIKERWTLGLELLCGVKEVKDGDSSGNNYRVQVGMNYALFD